MILFNFATRSRPRKAQATLESIKQFCQDEYKVLLKIDADDTETIAETFEGCIYAIGTSANKIDAINRDIPETGWDILVNISDDQLFIKPFNIDCGPDEFVHYPDGHVNERLSTMSVMGIDYYNQFGYVYHPDYVSLWSDNESMDVAKLLGCYRYIDEQIFIHNHPAWTGEKPDAQLLKTQAYYRQDERTYHKRKAAGFPIKSVYS